MRTSPTILFLTAALSACGTPAAEPHPDAGIELRTWMPVDLGVDLPVAMGGDPRSCGFAPILPSPADRAPYCDPVPRGCLEACGSVLTGPTLGCLTGCLGRDPAPPDIYFGGCQICFFRSLLACAAANGCEPFYVAQRCCQVACAEGDPSCTDPDCAEEREAADLCTFTRPACSDLTSGVYELCLGAPPEPGE
ncbi:MAG: hypothetical protein ACFCGT_00125 [Sandaracinaceae bacterium]